MVFERASIAMLRKAALALMHVADQLEVVGGAAEASDGVPSPASLDVMLAEESAVAALQATRIVIGHVLAHPDDDDRLCEAALRVRTAPVPRIPHV